MARRQASKVAVVGLWHQGVVGAACLADMGCDVLAADPNTHRVENLNAGKAPLYEPGLNELLGACLRKGGLRFTTSVADAVRDRPFVLLMFDTPVDENDQSDLAGLFAAVREMAPALMPGVTLLVTAQVPVGTCDEIAGLLEELNPGAQARLVYSPENLRLGKAIELFRKPALPVLGADDPAALDAVEELFAPMDVRWERVSLRTGEMTKHALNAFLAASISFGNELGNLCDEVGADGKRLAEVLRLEPRVGTRAMLLPGLGFSGGTIARDMQTLRGLGQRFQLPTRMLDGVWEANRLQNQIVVRKLRQLLGELKGRRVAVFGLTYKPDTSTLRRSAALEVISELFHLGAQVTAHDPRADREELARHSGFSFCEDLYDAARGAEAAVVMTPWQDYRAWDAARLRAAMAGALLLDPNNALDREAMAAAGFRCVGIGRGRQ